MKFLFLSFLLLQTPVQALELACEFKLQGAYPFLSTTVPMIDENTLGDEVIVDRFQGPQKTYPLRLLSLEVGELFKFSIADGSANEVYVTVFTEVVSGSWRSQVSNPEAPEYIKHVPGFCVRN